MKAALGPVDAEAKPVLVARRDLARPQGAARPIGVAQHDLDVVVELAPGPERGEIGGELSKIEAGHVVGEIVGVGADVAERPAGARALRIDAPFGLLVARRLRRAGQPVLRIFDLDEADLAEIAARTISRMRRTSG